MDAPVAGSSRQDGHIAGFQSQHVSHVMGVSFSEPNLAGRQTWRVNASQHAADYQSHIKAGQDSLPHRAAKVMMRPNSSDKARV